MVRPVPVQLTRSPAEISAINSLRCLPDLLLYSQRPQSARPNDAVDRVRKSMATSSVAALRSICTSRGDRQPIAECSTQHAEIGTLERWLALSDLAARLDDDTENLEKEIQAHERKRRGLNGVRLDGSISTKLPPAEACELGPKLQCLEEVLGTTRFRTYCHDLFLQVASLRQRLGLYGIDVNVFEQQLCRKRCVSREKLLELLKETAQDVSRPNAVDTLDPPEELPPVELADYALLLQHCSDSGSAGAVVVVEDLVMLLRSLPLERATLVRCVFEQIADTRRGEGHRPPPDHTKLHRVVSAIKLQRNHCSVEEMQAAETWLQGMNAEDMLLQDFFEFHLAASDAYIIEDAEFVRFVQRMWGFDPLVLRDSDRSEGIVQLVEGHTSRCHLSELVSRKRELLAKIPGAQSRIHSAIALLEPELHHLRTLKVPAGFSRWLQCDETLHVRLGDTLALLRELSLSGQVLASIPDFVSSLKELQAFNFRDNRLAMFSDALGTMKTLQKLNLSDNLLRDASFVQTDGLWSKLESLTELCLSGNGLTSLPSALTAIPNLVTLDLSRNSLRAIRGDVLMCWEGRSQLSVLDLHANSLTTLPEEIQVLSKTLRRLLLHQNQLSRLPGAALAQMRILEEISLSQNQLSGDSFEGLPLPLRQSSISLAHNQLRVLPRVATVQHDPISGYLNTSVVSVDVRSNRLRSVMDWSPLVLANCQFLHLQQNALRDLPDNFFTSFPGLRVCELQNNQLRTLPVGIASCTELQVLDVHDNGLQSLPKELVHLPFLEMLNAAENELTAIPIEWHLFATQHDGTRVLHSLLLRRNPLRNKILQSIVDGGGDGALSVSKARQTTSHDDPVCESVIRKLLDGLRDCSSIMWRTMDSRALIARKAWVGTEDDDDEDVEFCNKPKWRGIARDVNYYLEQRLRAMQRPQTTGRSSSLIVEVKSFERMIRTLPFTCSKRELEHLVRRFTIVAGKEVEQRAGGDKRKRQIDGLAFLQAIESFGRWRSISTSTKRTLNSTVKPSLDSAGPIIQYLVVLHRRMQQEQQWQQDKLDEDREEIVVQRPQLKQRPKIKIKTPNNRKKSHPNGPKIMKRTAPIVPPTKYEKDGKTQAEVIVDRQRQRIQVLEQQLLDQKLLFLAHRKSTIASISNGDPAIAPAALDVLCDDDERIGTDANDERGAYDRAVNISVKCLHMPEIQRGDDAKEQQTEKRRIPIVPARLDFRLLPDDTVLHLKQSLKTRTGVPIDHQILVASCVGRGSPAIRLRNDAVLREYAEKTGVGNRWTLTLLIGQSIPLYCKTSAT